MNLFSKEELFAVRNFIPIEKVIAELLQIPSKVIEGVFRFLCPQCHEFQTGVNPKTNLSRCFRCEKNFNSIDLVMKDRNMSFRESIVLLNNALKAHATELGGKTIAGI